MRIRLDSIGCRLNISEIEEMARRLASAGHRIVGPGDVADLYIFNTCAVTHIAARKSRQVIRQLRRANPKAAVVVTGCYAELSPAEVQALGVDMVVGNDRKDDLPDLLAGAGLLRDADPLPAVDASPYAPPVGEGEGHTRAFIKVQDGCDNRCTFCIVTIARGAGRSRPIAEVVAEVNRLVSLGYQEAVLSGVHLGSYGHDWGDPQGLVHLVQAVLAQTDLPRLRLSSLEPWDLDESFFALWQNERLLPHLHLPLQSGSDAVLRRMARRTSQAEFARLVETARAAIPDVAISTDIIVGFPGETDADFAESLAFVEQMAFSKLHIFRYSRREGTAAAAMSGQVPDAVVQARSRKMHELNARLEQNFRRRFVGRTLPVLWESFEPFGFGRQWSGLTGNYLRVVVQTGPEVNLRNQVLDTRLTGLGPGVLQGELVAHNGGIPANYGLLAVPVRESTRDTRDGTKI
ncbi:MAG: tRNA (N(6)-L-threonylcarbamoyladenosine(37)-C(2))-methylthiotransferase MtaB [Chloroflexi bacterium]|nr:MAG: tRNA (N(6)-L-threonylcarbamoyladenosine(37)-C(2))-methylthiotransferase MtaB [Chloroflexota bacterium]